MSVEHRRELVAFFIVALAAVLLIGNGLNNQALRDAISGGSERQAAIASGVSLVPGQTSIELGGSARGTTVIESDPARAGSSTTSDRRSTSPSTASEPAGPGRSEKTPNAKAPAQKPKTSDQKHTGKRTSPGSTRTTLSGARVTDDGTTVHGKSGHAKKDHARKHGKKHLRDDG